MTKVYPVSPQQLQDAIQNTIRIFNEYRLDKKVYVDSVYKINSGSVFYRYQMFTTPEGTQLKMTVGDGFFNMPESKASMLVEQFFSRVDQVIKGQIVLTADVVNRDVYKANQGVLAGIGILRLIVAAIAIAFGLYVLLGR